MPYRLLTLAVACALTSAQAQEITTTAKEQTDLNVTIYNSNVALIKDARTITLDEGINTLAFKEVSAAIQPESAILSADGVTLLEQNFEYDLLSPSTLLDKYVGKTVTIAVTDLVSGEVSEQPATVLSNNNGVMLKIGDKIRQLGSNMQVIYDDVPDSLRDRPTMTMRVNNDSAGEKAVELTYLSNNLTWKADYVVNLNDSKTLNIKGWVTLSNNSGTTYKDAKLQLVAGKVNRATQPVVGRAFSKKSERLGVNLASADMAEESLFEYHLYTLGFPTTIKNKQQKQVSLLEAANVPYIKRLTIHAVDRFNWYSWGNYSEYIDLTTNAKIVIDNKKSKHLGLPMPAGIMRTYQKDSRGNAQFIGEDRIKHTPENESISLQLGESFDVTAKRKQTAFKQQKVVKQSAVSTVVKQVNITASYEVLLKNAKDEAITVDYFENFPQQWEIVKQSLNSTKLNSGLNRWRVEVPAKGETKLTYTVKIVH